MYRKKKILFVSNPFVELTVSLLL
mgnify:CR=1